MSCEKCKEWQKQLDERNTATKVWIQADTQCRDYAHSLERRLEPSLLIKRKLQDIQSLMANGNIPEAFLETVKLHAHIDVVSGYGAPDETKRYTTKLEENIAILQQALKKLTLGWLYWPAKKQSDPRVVQYESTTLDAIEKMAKEALSKVKTRYE
jgi:hypothetical protein